METYSNALSKSTMLAKFFKEFDLVRYEPSIEERKLFDSQKSESTFSNTPLDDTIPFSRCEVYEGILKVKEEFVPKRNSNPPPRTIGDIKEFSKGARQRAFNWLLTLNTRILSKAIFVTLTYHNESLFEIGNCKTQLEKFLRKLREHIPECVYIWRMEYQKRGAPHFHLIIWSKYQNLELFSQAMRLQLISDWLSVKSCNCNFCKLYSVNVREVKERRHAISYLSKYCAKESDNLHESKHGRFWGTSFDAPRKPLSEIYLTKCQHDKLKALVKKFLSERKIKLPKCFEPDSFNESFSIFIDLEDSRKLLLEVLGNSPPD